MISFPAPAEILDRLHGLRDGTLAPTPPKDAATVILIRDADENRPDGTGRLEVFLLRRVATMVFGAGMYVFPGGKVDPADSCDAALPADWADQLTYGDPVLLARVVGAALRETVEEAGVRLEATALQPFMHWIAPEAAPSRFDTRFLIAALPAGQTAQVTDGEADRGLWASPRKAMELTLLPPTRAALEDLLECADTRAALTKRRNVRPTMPRAVHDGEGWRFEVDEPLP